MASEVELIDLLSGKGSLTLLAFPPVNPWLPILHADICLCCSHCIIYLLMRALFSKNLIAESKDWNKDARVWNLKQVLERKAGVPGITNHILILTPFLWALFCELPFRCPLFIQRISFAQNLSKLPFSVCNWTTYLDSGNISFPSESYFILNTCCHLSTSSSASDSATLMFPKKDLSFICCSYI